MDDAALYAGDDVIATLTLNRPEKRNPSSEPDGVAAMVGCLARAQADARVRVIIPTRAGTDLACMCDFGIASDTARCAESFVKIGIIPGDGGAWLPPRIAGWPKAGEMALTGDAVSAEAALACGLFSQGVPADQLMAAAASLPSGSRSTRRARCG